MQKRDAKPSSFQFFSWKKKLLKRFCEHVYDEENQEARDPLLGILETFANYVSTHHMIVRSQMKYVFMDHSFFLKTKYELFVYIFMYLLR